MTKRCDLHTHTHYLGCANETMTLPAMLAEASSLGVEVLGITDHLNTPDRLPLHVKIREELAGLNSPVDVYFGVELNFMSCDGDFAYSEEIRDSVGFQFAIGGIHATYLEDYDLERMIDIQHRHHLRTCEDPLVDVLVHPYWFSGGEFTRKGFPWFDSVKAVPDSYVRELGQVAKETGTAIEINACANLVCSANPPGYADAYADYLAALAAEGCTFSTGSDAHDLGRMVEIEAAWAMADRLGLSDDQLWSPSGAPFLAAAC